MENIRALIRIPFKPVLKQLTASVGLGDPLYTIIDSATNNVCVVIPRNSDSLAYYYVGGESASLDESREKAAEQAVCSLMKKYKIRIHDISLEEKEKCEQSSEFFRLKREQYKRIEKNLPIIEAYGNEVLKEPTRTICVNFRNILDMVISEVQIPVTAIQTIQLGAEKYFAWFAVLCPGTVPKMEWVIEDMSSTSCDAIESQAKKAIIFLKPLYGFEIKDANFHLMIPTIIECSLQRESYLAIRERVMGIKEDVNPIPVVMQQEPTTPRGSKFEVPQFQEFSPPPKKAKSTMNNIASSSTFPVSIQDELNASFDARK